MRPALYILALTADALAIVLILVAVVAGHMATPGVIASWAFIAILALNVTAIIVAWRFRSAKADESIVANTFS
jgi:membrane protein implicated in regulation of membrane protease activity